MNCEYSHSFEGNYYCMNITKCNPSCEAIRPIAGSEHLSSRWLAAQNDFYKKQNASLTKIIRERDEALQVSSQQLTNINNERLIKAIRARPVRRYFMFKPNQYSYIYTIKEDGSIFNSESIKDIQGEPSVSLLKFAEELGVKKQYFMILFEESLVYIWGEISKITSGDYLLGCFIRAGICFPQTIPTQTIKDALCSTFIPLIEYCDKTQLVQHRVGWDDLRRYRFPKNTIGGAGRFMEGLNLPVNHKYYEEVEVTENDIKAWCDFSNSFTNQSFGIILLVLPYVGLVSSLLKKEQKHMDKPVILLCDDMSKLENILELLMVFRSRDRSGTLSVSENRKEIISFLGNGGDELLVCYASFSSAGTKYLKQKLIAQMHEVISYASESEQLPTPYQRKCNSPVVIVSDFTPDEGDAYFLEWEDSKEGYQIPFSSVRAIWSDFIHWIERNMDETLNAIRLGEGEHAAFSITWKLLKDYFHWRGQDIFDEPDWSSIFIQHEEFEDILQVFKTSAIRKARECQTYLNEILETKDSYGFPTESWKAYLGALSLDPYAMKIIKRLKEEGFLKCEDKSGNDSRHYSNGKRKSYYMISKNFFDDLGDLPFGALANRRDEKCYSAKN